MTKSMRIEQQFKQLEIFNKEDCYENEAIRQVIYVGRGGDYFREIP